MVTPQPTTRRVMVSFGLLAGILIVAGFMAVQFAPRASAPSKAPAAAVAVDYGPAPLSVPLVWVHDPKNPSWLIGYDWTGLPRGTIKLDPAIRGVGMSPDGQTLTVGVGGKGGTGQQLDRLGRPIAASGGLDGKADPLWADDNVHMCGVSLDQQTLDWTLITVLPGQPVKPVAVLARDPSIGQSGLRLASCSFRNDKAIVVRTTIAWPAESWVARLSDGKVLTHTTYDRVLSNVIGSADSTLVAENSTKATGDTVGGAAKLVIRRVSDGSVVASLDPTLGVLAFSGDDSLALVTTSAWFGEKRIHLAVVDVQSGSVVWRYEGPEGLGTFLAQPGGSSFAIALVVVPVNPSPCGTTPQTACRAVPEDPLRDVLIVRGNGETLRLPGRYQTTW